MGQLALYSAALTPGGLTGLSVFDALKPDADAGECVRMCEAFLAAIGEEPNAVQTATTELTGSQCWVSTSSEPGAEASFTVDRCTRRVVLATLTGVIEQGSRPASQNASLTDAATLCQTFRRRLHLPSNLADTKPVISVDGAYAQVSSPLHVHGYPFIDGFRGAMFSVNLIRRRLAVYQLRLDHPPVLPSFVRLDGHDARRAARLALSPSDPSAFEDFDAELGWAKSEREPFARLCWKLSLKGQRRVGQFFVDAEDGHIVKISATK